MNINAKETEDSKAKTSGHTRTLTLNCSTSDELKIENFPCEIQERIFNELSAVDRVRIERVCKKWRSIVRKNGWGRKMELNCICLQNFNRLKPIGFAPLVRQLVLHTDCEYADEGAKEGEKHRKQIRRVFNVSAFSNLVHLRIGHVHCLMIGSLLKQIEKLKGLKTLSLAYYKCKGRRQFNLFIKFSSLEVLVMDKHESYGSSFFTCNRLKSLWLDGTYCLDEVYPGYNDIFRGLQHLGFGRTPLEKSLVKPICELKDSLRHLSFALPCYYYSPEDYKFGARFEQLYFDDLALLFSQLSVLVSLELEDIGPNELTLIFNHCKKLEHFSFIFAAKKGVTSLNVVEMMQAMRGLPTALPHLRSLDFLLTSRLENHESTKSVVAELLAPTMRKLADQGRIEYLNPVIFGWDEERKKREQIHLPDDVAFQFLLRCNSLRFLGHQFLDSDSKGRLTKILDDKLASGERSLAGHLLLIPKQHFPFSHLLVASAENKPRNHVFCAIREAGLTAVPLDFFFPKTLNTCSDRFFDVGQ